MPEDALAKVLRCSRDGESAVERLLDLATVPVRGYQRFERGKNQVVRPHNEMRAPGRGYIPQAQWRQGQQDWEKAGEAAWAKGRESWAQDRLQDIAHGEPQAPPALRRAPGQSLQDFVESREMHQQAQGRRLADHPAFKVPAAEGSPGAHIGAINDAADKAVDDAAVRGGMAPDEVAQLRRELADMQARLAKVESEASAERLAQRGNEAAQKAEQGAISHMQHLMHEKGRAALVLNILAIVATLIIGYFTGGGTESIIAELVAAKWTIEAAKSLLEFHVVDKGAGRKQLAHPVRETAAGARQAASGARKVARKVSPAPRRRGP